MNSRVALLFSLLFSHHLYCCINRAQGCRILNVAMVTLSFLMVLPGISTGLTSCPSACSNISALPYPFGAALGCGSPGFLLDCSFSPPQWNISTGDYTASYYITSIHSNPNYSNPQTGSYGYGGMVLLDMIPTTNSTCQVLDAASSATSSFTSQDLYSFDDAKLIYYQESYLFFNCSATDGIQPPNSGVLITNSSSSCTKYLEYCNFSTTWSCLEYIPDQKLQLSPFRSTYLCETRTRFVIPPGNENVSSWIPRLQLAWGPVKDADSCSACQRTGGTCGYDTEDKSFRCYCDNKAYQKDCNSGNSNKAIAIGVSLSVVLLLFLATGVAFHYRHKCGVFANRKFLKLDGVNEAALEIPYWALSAATKSFSTKIGQGAFAKVYKGELYDGNEVAVKVLDSSVFHSDVQVLNEVASIGNIHHRNIARLVGYCFSKSRRILVYEYVSNGSLDKYLFSKENVSLLNWKQRFEIAVGIARGLSYMHEECRKCIVHCDIKPHNILLDDVYCPKVADFGLARLLKRDESRVFTHARGTPGYVAPEFWSSGSGLLSAKFDVYSYGMVLLEIIRGRRNFQEFDPYSKEALNSFVSATCIDEKIADGANLEQAEMCTRAALWCIQDDPSVRPTMSRVVQYLQGTAAVPHDPPKPFRTLLNQSESSSGSGSLLKSFDGSSSTCPCPASALSGTGKRDGINSEGKRVCPIAFGKFGAEFGKFGKKCKFGADFVNSGCTTSLTRTHALHSPRHFP